jgi:cardiolipin synthase
MNVSFLKRKLLRIPLYYHFAALLLILIAMATWGILFIRRAPIEYHAPQGLEVTDESFFASAHALCDPLPVEGNKITLLHNGDAIFPAMLEAIRGARKSINFEAFLFYSDSVGTQFRDALSERAKAGVRVRVLLDGIGSGKELDDSYVDVMKQSGCAFSYFHPTRSWRTDRLNNRSHRRILVVDGKVGFTGGVGFADDWLGNADAPKHWREVHAKLEGPIVAKLQSAFQSHWLRETGEVLSGPDEYPDLNPAGNTRAQVVATHAHSASPLALVQAVSFSAARKSILITNAYCAPSDSQVEYLVAAVKRGVDVRLLLPGKHNDQPMTKAAGRSAYRDLLQGGVKIFEYQPTMIHSKTMVIDEVFSVFGSSNFDARSAQINEELDISVYDPEFGKEMVRVFERDLQKARPYLLEDFRKRSVWERTTEWLVLPFHSQL